MFNESFQQFLIEASLASSSIRGGLTAVNKCDINDKGTFYNAFFQLSIGLERVFKLVYILHHMIDHNLKKPDFKDLKNLGHDISSLQKKATEIGRLYRGDDFGTLTDIQEDILIMLSDFGVSTRYYNLNTILDSKNKLPDPLTSWGAIIERCYWEHIPQKKRKKVFDDAIQLADRIGDNSFTLHHSLDGHLMTLVDLVILQWKLRNVSPCIVAEIIGILQPYYFLFSTLKDKIFEIDDVKGTREAIVPYFEEIFTYFLEEPSRAKKRRNWLK